ncbi:xylulokinase [Nocardioides korecus]
MTLVAGVDCSTQATKVVVVDAADGRVVREGRAAHPDATELDPRVWWTAWQEASADLLDGVEALAVGGQQHGMVLLDETGEPVRDALLWNDNRSAPDAEALVQELGGPQAWAEATGSVPVASFTVTKLRWVARHEPEVAARAAAVLLPHDYLTHRLRGSAPLEQATTDRGDASGTGYWSDADGYRQDLLELALGRVPVTPRVAGPAEVVGRTPDGVLLGAGTGDNMATALGLGLRPGDVVVSLGTSGTVFAPATSRTADPTGIVAGFADATGGFLYLVCTLNAARVLEAAVSLAGTDLTRLDELALSVPDAGGLVLLPFLDGERTPPLPDATGLLHGLTRRNATPAHLVRAAVDGLLCGLADAVEAVRDTGVVLERIVLVGGAARSHAVRTLAAAMFGVPVLAPTPAEYVALGAARQAAWALSGADAPPTWEVEGETFEPDQDLAAASAAARSAYREVLRAARPLLG